MRNCDFPGTGIPIIVSPSKGSKLVELREECISASGLKFGGVMRCLQNPDALSDVGDDKNIKEPALRRRSLVSSQAHQWSLGTIRRNA